MDQIPDDSNVADLSTSGRPLDLGDEAETVGSAEYAAAYGEDLDRTLDLNTWQPGQELAALYQRLEDQIHEAVRQEDDARSTIRRELFPLVWNRPGAPHNAGLYLAKPSEIEMVHRGFLFNGRVEACDGTSLPHDTLPLTIVQIGVCLVTYRGSQGSWVQRLYRRDLRLGGGDPVQEVLDLLEQRRRRDGHQPEGRRDRLTRLARRGILSYAETAALLQQPEVPWKMGHGNPAPYELLTGSGMVELVEQSLEVLEALLLEHQKFVFISGGVADRMLLTIGNALQPGEYAIVDTMEDQLLRVAAGHYGGAWSRVKPRLDRFIQQAGPCIVVGVDRASPLSPVQMFYAHVDHAHQAALIALSDSVLQEHRGFPMLITLANAVANAAFGPDSLVPQVQAAYARVGAPLRYQTQR
jgi:hypothetical protein